MSPWRAGQRPIVSQMEKTVEFLEDNQICKWAEDTAFFVASASKFDCQNSRRSIMRRTRTVVAHGAREDFTR
jgi:hypothetical protein